MIRGGLRGGNGGGRELGELYNNTQRESKGERGEKRMSGEEEGEGRGGV